MENNYLDNKAIVKFLSVYKDDESLRSYFLRRFDHPDNMSWHDAETSYKLDYLFVDDDNSRKFWIENFSQYSFFYIYALLSKWSEEYDEDTILKKRCENYLRLYTSQLDDNIVFLKKNCHTIPTSIIAEVGFIIDSYLWLYHTEAPFFLKRIHKGTSDFEKKYQLYLDLFKESIKEKSVEQIKKDITDLLSFCNSVDVEQKEECFKHLIKKLSGTEINMCLSSMLHLIVNNTITTDNTYYELKFLKIITDYYCENYSLSKSDVDVVKRIQFKLYETCINYYLNNYENFIDSPSLWETSNIINYGHYIPPFEDYGYFETWMSCAKPWNYINYYKELNLYDFKLLFAEFKNSIKKDVSKNIREVIKQAGKNEWSKTCAKTELKKRFKIIICDNIREYKKSILSCLQKYKNNKIEECVHNAIKDCHLTMNQYLNSFPKIEIHITENSVLTYSEVLILFSFQIGDILKMKFLFDSSVNKDPLETFTELVLPTKYFDWVINKRRFWGNWGNEYISDKEKEEEDRLLDVYLDSCYDYALDSIIKYLDYDYVKSEED